MANPTTIQPTAKSFRQPWKTVAGLSAKTAQYTKPIDPAIEKTIAFVNTGYSVTKKQVDKLPKINPTLLLSLALVASGFISFLIAIPAIIFFPITIFFGIATSFLLIVFAPLGVVLGWLLLSSTPVQQKIVSPFLDKITENKKIAKILYEE